ncbi:hypothetical protein AB0C04_01665 [Micromonospora sp. NPDC048909]|uniref:hypothetical protein n=1 Tax=Micromonospora sp. NPDC048909 TaxID=3155643 RepID=UPI0033FF93FD
MTISSYLLILFAVLQVINLIITLTTIGTIRDVLRDAYRGTEANGAETIADFTFAIGIGTAIFVLLLAIGLVVLAMLNNRGKNGSRITTWILGGILICCTGGSLISGAAGGLGGAGGGSTSGDMPSGEEIQRRLDDALPGWFTPLSTVLGVLGVLALLAALILLALPKSNEFFRKPKAGWEPPVPGAAYPGYPPAPGYPQGPGQPGQPSGDPGYPPAPGYPPPSQPGPSGQPPAPGQSGDQPPPSDRPGSTPPPVS